MAEMLTITETRNYELSTGTKVDLVALINGNTARPAGHTKAESVDEMHVGQIVYVNALNGWRRGVVTKVAKTRVNVAVTTQSAVDACTQGQPGAKVRVQNSPYYPSDVLVDTGADEAEVAEEIAAEAEANLAATDETLAKGEELITKLEVTENVDRAEAIAIGDLEQAEARQVARTGSAIVSALEALWASIRANHPELPGVVMVTGTGLIGPARWGHFRREGWEERSHEAEAVDHSVTKHGEMFIGGETLAAGALKTLETVLHEAAHVLAAARGAQDTSRQGRWHNGTFRTTAEELGLEYPHEKADSKIGFSAVILSPGTADDYAAAVEALDEAIGLVVELPAWLKGEGGKAGATGGGEHIHHGGKAPRDPNAKKSNSNNVKATCECETPRIIRVSKAVLAGAMISCSDCGGPFMDRSAEADTDDEE